MCRAPFSLHRTEQYPLNPRRSCLRYAPLRITPEKHLFTNTASSPDQTRRQARYRAARSVRIRAFSASTTYSLPSRNFTLPTAPGSNFAVRLLRTDVPPVGDFPMRRWNITIYMVNDKGQDVAADVFEKVTYELHPSFEKRAKQGMARRTMDSLLRYSSANSSRPS